MVHKLLQVIGFCVVRFPGAIVVLYALAALAALLGSVFLLELNTNQDDLMAADAEYNQRYRKFLADFADLEFIYVVIQVEDNAELAIRAAETLAAELEPLKSKGYIHSVYYRVPLEDLGYGLLFEETGTLEQLVAWLEDHQEDLARLSQVDRFERLFQFLSGFLDVDQLAEANSEGGDGGQERFTEWGFRLLSAVLSTLEAGLDGEDSRALTAQLAEELGLSLTERGYLATAQDRFLLVEVLPEKDTTTLALIREPLLAIRAVLADVRARFPEVQMGLTGRPVFQYDEMTTTDRDMRLATVIALAGVFLLFVVFFRRIVRPLLAVICLNVAILLVFGLVSVTIGYLTLLSIVFAAMLVGLGIDFGIHFVARYDEELTHGKCADDAARTTLLTTGASIGTGALTTAAAFYTTLFVDFQGLRELGFIAGTGVVLCFLSMVTLLPALLVLIDRRRERRRELKPVGPLRVPGIEGMSRHPVPVFGVILIVTVVGLWFFGGVSYNYNVLDLQAQGIESVEYEMLLIKESDTATWYAAFVVNTLEEARQTADKLAPLKDEGVVGRVESALDVIPSQQREKMSVLARGAKAVSDIALPRPSPAVDPTLLAATLDEFLDTIDELQDLLLTRQDTESRAALGEVHALAERVERVSERLRSDAEAARERIGARQVQWFKEFHALLEDLRQALRHGPLTPETLPSILRSRFVSRDGSQFLVYAYPKKDIWEEENMEEFITSMRERVDPRVTGSPVTFYESAWRMKDGFVRAACYSFVVVFLLLLLDLGRLSGTLLAMVPLVVGLFWLGEVVSLAGLSFNLANFFAVPILIGCGIDGGVHIVHRFRESGSAAEVRRTTCSAVALSFLTTMVGFGALSFASHRGVASLGLVMVIGLLCLSVASVVLLPSILTVTNENRMGELFAGRNGRWTFVLWGCAALGLALMICPLEYQQFVMPIWLLAHLPNVVRRFHDLNRPAWHMLLGLIPIYNIWLGLMLLFGPGTSGLNRYGEAPRMPRAVHLGFGCLILGGVGRILYELYRQGIFP